MKITILALGSVGDVQPAIAVGQGLEQLGHDVKVASFSKFESNIRRAGLQFYKMEMNPQTCLDNFNGKIDKRYGKRKSMGALLTTMKSFGPALKRAARESLDACGDAQGIVYNGFASYFGRSIAMKMCIPEAHLAIQPSPATFNNGHSMSQQSRTFSQKYRNIACGLLKKSIMTLFSLNVNQWRREELGLDPIRQPYSTYMRHQKVTDIGCYSRHVVPPVNGSHRGIYISGFCFTDSEPDWQPDARLAEFLKAGERPFYFDFNSGHFTDPAKTARVILEAAQKAGQRIIFHMDGLELPQSELPEYAIQIGDVPESRLFPLLNAVIHHGDSLTSAWAMRAGVPSIIVSCDIKEPFWAGRVFELGIGPAPLSAEDLTAEKLANAIQTVKNNQRMQETAAWLSERIQSENGAKRAAGLIDKKFSSSLFAQTEVNEKHKDDMFEQTASFTAA